MPQPVPATVIAIPRTDDPLRMRPAASAARVAEAVRSGHPSVIVFATPAFCTNRTCGPVLDTADPPVNGYPEVNRVSVEVYENLDAPSPEALVVASPVLEWGLPNEPWGFVATGRGW